MVLVVYYCFGVELSHDEIEYIGKNNDMAAGAITIPNYLHFMIANNYLRRNWNSYLFWWKNLLQKDYRFRNTKKYKKIISHCNNNNINKDMARVGIIVRISHND